MTIDAQTHRSLAVEANNSTWEFLARPVTELSSDEIEEMTRRAYAAAYHWARAHGASIENEARADWLLSRVWVVQSHGQLALHYASRCLAACERGHLKDFDLAYAHESLARAHACLGNLDDARRHRDAAQHVVIVDPDDKSVVDGDLRAEPWFGL